MERRTLDEGWTLRPATGGEARPIDVPGCWEAAGVPVMDSGPFVYRREISVPDTWHDRRIWLRFDGASYDARVRVNGHEVGHHTGLWDGFRVEVGAHAPAGRTAVVEVEVVKPAGLLDGPDGPVVEGPFPLRQTLAGFLPYVWGHVFGGIWQQVVLEASHGPVPTEVFARGTAEGGYVLRVAFAPGDEASARVEAVLKDPEGCEVARHGAIGTLEAEGCVADVLPWSPESPRLYTLEVRVEGEVVAERRFGFRSVGRRGSTILLNGTPVYPRMVLSWGWYPDTQHANPTRERVREDFERLRAMGFNGVKYCLWVPPPHVLEVADELGMLVWLELPMWLPHVSATFLAQTPVEYDRIVRSVRHHPSIVLYSLGCELNSSVGAELLERLYHQTKALVGDAILRDNSGSGEAYGGLLDEFAEYYDYHFYAELPTFRPLLDHFAPRTRPVQPYLFGEFCDSDGFRDLREFDALPEGRPWWARADEQHNPKGARWQYDTPWIEERLRANGFWDRGAELAAISRRQSLLQRKATLEVVRSYREIGGYVITGERDTPISTSGVFDDHGDAKFAADDFAAFNGATVLSLAWDRRRAWVHGGDRAAPWDPYGYRAGDPVRAKIVVAHHGRASGTARVDWRVERPDGSVVAEGRATSAASFEPGSVREATIARFAVPAVDIPVRLTLSARATIGGERTENAWPLWTFPQRREEDEPTVAVHDPERVLAGIERVACVVEDAPDVLLASEWSTEIDDRVRAGAKALLLVRGRPDDPVRSVGLPFWREAVKVIEPHPAWGDFPHEGWTDLQFFSLSPDRALELEDGRDHTPILTRVDARTMAVHAYATTFEHGRGRVLATTLRFGGGLGEQASGIARNVCGQALLGAWLRWLAAA